MITLLLSVVLSVAPWTGPALPAAAVATASYRLEMTGTPKSVVHLRTSGVAEGWIAAFCTSKYCSPNALDVTLPASGRALLQFELIRESDTAPKASGVTISSEGASVAVPAAHIP
jgi:hypothetical protein